MGSCTGWIDGGGWGGGQLRKGHEMVEGIETSKRNWKGGGVAERKNGEVEHQKTMWRKVR